MRIAIVTKRFRDNGGLQTFTRDLAALFSGEGHGVSIIDRESLPRNPTNDVERRVGEYFNGLNERERFDLVFCNSEMGCAVQHPCAVNIFHGNYYAYAMAVRDFVSRELTEERLRKAEMQRAAADGKYVVSMSRFDRQGLEKLGFVVDQTIPLGVDPSLFYPRWKSISNHALAASRGRYFEKGFDILERLGRAGVKIRLFSDRTIDSPNIDNRGFVSNEDLPDEYGVAQLLLNPSRFEGGGLTTLEAMACGTPVITTPTGYGMDIRDIIPAFVVEDPANIDEFIAKHREILEDRANYAKRAIDYVEEFHNPERIRREWISLADRLVDERQESPLTKAACNILRD